MALNAAQKKQMEELKRLEAEPERTPPSVNYNLDLSDDKAYERAVKLGIIEEPGSNGGEGEGEGEGGSEGDETPKRRSFFGDES